MALDAGSDLRTATQDLEVIKTTVVRRPEDWTFVDYLGIHRKNIKLTEMKENWKSGHGG